MGKSFEQATAGETNQGTLIELWHFVRSNRRWWMIPIILLILLFGILLVLSSTAAAPFIYTLF